MTQARLLPGLRERKAALLKLKLVELLTAQLTERPFREITVDELCEGALVSRVTFFKYFPTKDALLWFQSKVWVYRLKADCRLRGLEGVEALSFLFEVMAEEFDRHLMLYAHFFSLSEQQAAGFQRPRLTDAEVLALYPDGSTLDLDIDLSLGDFLREHCGHARSRGDFRTDMALERQVALLGSLWHGSGFVGMRVDPARPGRMYRITFEAIIELLAP